MTKAPEFLVLTPLDCAEVLTRNHVGRLAYRIGETVDIQPVGYVANGSWIFLRSGHGAKLEALAHNPYVAFEVDEVEGPFDWRSVVAHGTIYLLPPDGAPIEQREFQRALKALRGIMPETLTTRDPVPERQTVYGLHIDRMDGRMAQSQARPGRKPASRSRVAKRPAPKRRRPPDGF
jgi:nitroimidazol reductase NimA-like FMN-containing flavoprotein (pyridoxamine 5'-phosphate oxidase superfamily)